MKPTKKIIIPGLIALCATTLLSGCIALSLGGGSTTKVAPPTVGQQLVDLKKAKDSGAINQQEYDAQKAKILAGKQ